MANDSFVLRIFSGNQEFSPSFSSVENLTPEKIASAVEALLGGKWQVVGRPIKKPGSGEFDPVPSAGEVWVEVVPKSETSVKSSS